MKILEKENITYVLYSLGFVAIGLGSFFILSSFVESNYEFTEFLSDIPQNRTLPMDSPYYLLDAKDKTAKLYNEGQLDLTKTYFRYHMVANTKDVYSVANPINIQVYAKVVGQPLVKDVIFLIHSPALNYSLINDESFDRIIDAYRGESVLDLEKQEFEECLTMDYFFFGRTIDQQPKQGFDCFFYSDHFTYPVPRMISFAPFVRDYDDSIYKIDRAENVIEVYPAYTKLQAETNRVIIETAKIQARNNDLILGFTLMVIAGIPFTVGTHLILSERKEHEILEKKLGEIEEKVDAIKENTINAENKIMDVWKRVYDIFQDYKK